jgi:glycosyltransferase involved in cell wall biosynthesis
VNSEVARGSYEGAGFDISKVEVVPLGADLRAPEPGDRLGLLNLNGAMRFLYAGKLSALKGGHTLIAAWKKVAAHWAAELHIVGKVELPGSVLEHLPGNVRVHGPVPKQEMDSLYSDSDVLLFPTLCDGFGMVVTEALAHGVPVVTTPRAGANMLIEDGINGLRVEAGNADCLADALQWCVANKEKLRAMRPACLETARTWNWARYRRRIGEIVAETIARQRNGAA